MLTRRSMISACALVGAAASTRALRARATRGPEADLAVRRDDADWRRRLTPGQYAALRRGDAEPAFSSPLLGEARRGVYACAGCRQDAFPSAAKLDDGDGWPGFWAAFYGAVTEVEAPTAPVFRANARCSRCGGHLGAVTRGAATPTGLRYRVEGAALVFTPDAARPAAPSRA